MPYRTDQLVGKLLTLAVATALLVACAFFIVYGIVGQIATSRFLERSATTTGTVARVWQQPRKTEPRKMADFAEITFLSHDGQPARFQVQARRAVGEQVPVVYDRDSPDNAMVDDFWAYWAGLVIVGIFTPFFALLLWMALAQVRELLSARRLVSTGTKAWAPVVRLEAVRKGFEAIAEWQDPLTGQLHQFRSERLRHSGWSGEAPGDALLGRTVAVWVEPNDPTRYVMDYTSFP